MNGRPTECRRWRSLATALAMVTALASLAVVTSLASPALAATDADVADTRDAPAGTDSAGDARMRLPPAPPPFAGCKTRVDAIGALVDNDSFAGQRRDGGYTSGIRIEAPGGPGSVRSRVDGWLELALTSGLDVTCAPARGGFADRSLFVAQEIYTPQTITETGPQANDRPWAGMITVGRGWESVGLRGGGALVARRLELAVNVVGDASLGRQSQRLAHRWISGDEALGWDNQLRNRWGLSASYLERQRWLVGTAGDLPVDVISHWGLALGHIVTQARAGAMMRFGNHGCTLATPGLVTQPIALGGSAAPACPSGSEGPAGEHQFVFIGFDVRRVVRNELIEGRPRAGENHASARPWVGDLKIGFAWGVRDWTLSYTLMRRSSDFKAGDGSHCCNETYGAISLALTW